MPPVTFPVRPAFSTYSGNPDRGLRFPIKYKNREETRMNHASTYM